MKMTFTLSPEWEAFVAKQVQDGQFPSPDDVVYEALRLLRERKQDKEAELERLRQDILEGINALNQGKKTTFNEECLERIKAKGRAQLQPVDQMIHE
jgi:putative addiction module CopG family antidote